MVALFKESTKFVYKNKKKIKFLEFFFNKNPIFLLYINMFADYSEKMFRL